MKATGVVRKVDGLGRIVIPIELRRTFDLEVDDAVEIFVDDDYIMLKKYQPTCVFCSDAKNVETYMGKNVCKNCMAALAESSIK